MTHLCTGDSVVGLIQPAQNKSGASDEKVNHAASATVGESGIVGN